MYTSESDIQDFINDYLRSRVVSETSVRSTLKKILQYEDVFKKPFTGFTEKEILQFFTAQKSRSVISLQNQAVILKHATKWFIYTGITKETTNNYELVTKSKLTECIDKNVKRDMLMSAEEVRSLVVECLNDIDKAIIWLLFYGVAGEWLKELTFLEDWQLNTKSCELTLKDGTIIELPAEIVSIVVDAFKETQVISYGGDKISINTVDGDGQIYKVRCNAVHGNVVMDINDPKDVERRFRWVLRRITIIRNYFEISLTMKSLQASGFWHFAKENVKDMNVTSFKAFLETENGKALARRYGFKSDFYVQTLINKYEDYL